MTTNNPLFQLKINSSLCLYVEEKKRAQLKVKFQADLVKPLPKQPKEHGILARFNESQLNNFANWGDGKVPRDSSYIIKLMLLDECTDLWTGNS